MCRIVLLEDVTVVLGCGVFGRWDVLVALTTGCIDFIFFTLNFVKKFYLMNFVFFLKIETVLYL